MKKNQDLKKQVVGRIFQSPLFLPDLRWNPFSTGLSTSSYILMYTGSRATQEFLSNQAVFVYFRKFLFRLTTLSSNENDENYEMLWWFKKLNINVVEQFNFNISL